MTHPRFPEPGSTDVALSVRTHDRAGDKRVDEAWLAGAWADPSTRAVPLAVSRFPVSEDGGAVRWRTAHRGREGLGVRGVQRERRLHRE